MQTECSWRKKSFRKWKKFLERARILRFLRGGFHRSGEIGCMNESKFNPDDSRGTCCAAVQTGKQLRPSDDEPASDAALISRFHEGDESAFVQIVHRYQGKMYALAYRVMRNAADAEEIVQDTFIRAHRALIDFRGEAALTSWLSRIALNLSRSRYTYFARRRRKESISLERPLNDATQATLADYITADIQDPVQETAASEFTRLVAMCMEKLDAPHREILMMRSVLELPYEEIAVVLGLNMGTVKSRVGRARQNLRKLIAQAAPDFGVDPNPSDFFITNRTAYGCEGTI